LAKEDNLKVVYSNQIKAFKQNDEDVEIKLNDNIDIRTKLLIGSDGVNSFIRQKADFDVTKWDYEQTAIVATLKLDEVT
jgi:2-polyprenyl-6-methoxyphenol hydroxylase-like FAD-dependent oxidoreductase